LIPTPPGVLLPETGKIANSYIDPFPILFSQFQCPKHFQIALRAGFVVYQCHVERDISGEEPMEKGGGVDSPRKSQKGGGRGKTLFLVQNSPFSHFQNSINYLSLPVEKGGREILFPLSNIVIIIHKKGRKDGTPI
jgi:hypothetical protein